MDELVKFGVDLYKGDVGTKFSKSEAEAAFRAKLLELAGTEKIDYATYRKIKPEFFEIIRETLDLVIPETVEEQFSEFAEVRNVAFGDKPQFEVEDYQLFQVATIAEGNMNLRRQRLFDKGYINVETHWKGVKIYEELIRFLAGRINWPTFVNRVAESFNRQLALDIYNAWIASYDTLTAPYKVTGSIDADQLMSLIQHVEAATNRSAVIVGTKAALGKVPADHVSDQLANQKAQLGYYGIFRGTPMRELKQAHKWNTDEFALSDSDLLIIPTGDFKPVKVVMEGETLIEDVRELRNADMTIEYTFMKKFGVAVISPLKYGIYRIE